MARAGLGPEWKCLFANDINQKKCRTYANNWGTAVLKSDDIRNVSVDLLPGRTDLAWASFPCQDLSLAGNGAGLKGGRSGAFWPFWDVMKGLVASQRAPKIIAVENVCGAITSHQGKDFTAICEAFSSLGYLYGALVIDAKCFLPHSRPRLFILGVRKDFTLPRSLVANEPAIDWHTSALRRAAAKLSHEAQASWLWWRLPMPRQERKRFSDLIETAPETVTWHTAAQTRSLLAMMSDTNRAKVEAAKTKGTAIVGGVYKRTRVDSHGKRVQRAEVRFDELAGCLRTPVGGSSRQTIIIIEGESVSSRLVSARETARLMGLPDSYKLPGNYNEAYHLTGDGVAVPVVRHLARHIFEPLLAAQHCHGSKAAA